MSNFFLEREHRESPLSPHFTGGRGLKLIHGNENFQPKVCQKVKEDCGVFLPLSVQPSRKRVENDSIPEVTCPHWRRSCKGCLTL